MSIKFECRGYKNLCPLIYGQPDKTSEGVTLREVLNKSTKNLMESKKLFNDFISLINDMIPKITTYTKGRIKSLEDLQANKYKQFIIGSPWSEALDAMAMAFDEEEETTPILKNWIMKYKNFNLSYYINDIVWWKSSEIDELNAHQLAELASKYLKIKYDLVDYVRHGNDEFIAIWGISSVSNWDNPNTNDDPNQDQKDQQAIKLVNIINNHRQKQIIFNDIICLKQANRPEKDTEYTREFDNKTTAEWWQRNGYDAIADGWKNGVIPKIYLRSIITPENMVTFTIKELADLTVNNTKYAKKFADDCIFGQLAKESETVKYRYLYVNGMFTEIIKEFGEFQTFDKIKSFFYNLTGLKALDYQEEIRSCLGQERGQLFIEWSKTIIKRLDLIKECKSWENAGAFSKGFPENLEHENVPNYLFNKYVRQIKNGHFSGPINDNAVEFCVNMKKKAREL